MAAAAGLAAVAAMLDSTVGERIGDARAALLTMEREQKEMAARVSPLSTGHLLVPPHAVVALLSLARCPGCAEDSPPGDVSM